MSSKSSGYTIRPRTSTVSISQASSVAKEGAVLSVSTSSSRAENKSDGIRSIFRICEQMRLTRTSSTYPFLSHQMQSFSTPPAPPQIMAPLCHGGTGPANPPVKTGTSTATSTTPFYRTLRISKTDETETTDAQTPERTEPDLTPFAPSSLWMTKPYKSSLTTSPSLRLKRILHSPPSQTSLSRKLATSSATVPTFISPPTAVSPPKTANALPCQKSSRPSPAV